MIDKKNTLTVFKDDAGTITDLSYDMADFLRDTNTVTIEAADYLYIGYYKPFNAMYVSMATPEINGVSLTLEIWNGSAWVSANSRDETKNLTRDGFITWNKGSMELSTIEGENLAWVRLSVSVDTSAIVFNGINIVFSDKATIQQEFYEIDSVIQESKLIAKLVASRNEIMDRLAQRGYVKLDSDAKEQDLTPFDLHDVYQIKSAATNMTLAKIFLSLSDNMEDHWWSKYEVYQKRAMEALQLFKLDVDLDDDGKDDETVGQKKARSIRFSR